MGDDYAIYKVQFFLILRVYLKITILSLYFCWYYKIFCVSLKITWNHIFRHYLLYNCRASFEKPQVKSKRLVFMAIWSFLYIYIPNSISFSFSLSFTLAKIFRIDSKLIVQPINGHDCRWGYKGAFRRDFRIQPKVQPKTFFLILYAFKAKTILHAEKEVLNKF